MRTAVLLALAAVLTLTGCDSPAPPGPTSAVPGRSTAGEVRVAIVGDSITDVQSPDFSAGRIDPESWASEVLDEGRVFAGGYAVWGATTEQMAAAVQPLDADVLIVLAGTNDMALGVPFAETAANLEAIAETVGAPRVVLSAIPPIDWTPGASDDFNAQLERLARDEGWEWVDPMGRIESGGEFREGMSDDGVHPSARASRLIGEAIESAVWPEDGA
ncbi:GDSL-type esterase/lipase family protein [Naasia sp. SYSU D00948]|uniref:SGNH/GDSL hydrolase family protein n=1 Tax=Naasia sp. SYSU D00948 TaxID=2817379 RepID=UPI001B304FAC|nr:GDSL-type esterase/lipase family protein [Naasia sp. SYSU D00948]